jgi:hypothetical protein
VNGLVGIGAVEFFFFSGGADVRISEGEGEDEHWQISDFLQ